MYIIADQQDMINKSVFFCSRTPTLKSYYYVKYVRNDRLEEEWCFNSRLGKKEKKKYSLFESKIPCSIAYFSICFTWRGGEGAALAQVEVVGRWVGERGAGYDSWDDGDGSKA